MSAATVLPELTEAAAACTEAETLPKNRVWLYFSDPDVHHEYQMYMRSKLQKHNYFVTVAMVNNLTLINCCRVFFFLRYTPEDIRSSMTDVFFAGYMLTLLGFFLSLFLTLMQWKRVQTCLSDWFSDLHKVRLFLVFGALFFLKCGNGLSMTGRVLVGECDNDTPLIHCNLSSGPPLVQFSLIIVGVLYSFITCKSMLPFRVIMILWATSSLFLVYVTYLEFGAGLVALGVSVCAFCILFVLHVMIYQEMDMFEYHVALQKSMQTQLAHSQDQAERDKTQLKMVLANVAHDLKTPLQAFSAGMHSLQGLMANGNSKSTPPVKANASAIMKDMEAGYAFMMMQINRALDVSKSGEGLALLAKPEPISLRDTVTWALNIMTSIQNRVTLKLKSSPTAMLDTFILTDKVWFQENLLCLLSNAVKYSPGDSCVSVCISLTGAAAVTDREQLLVEVMDEGVGVPFEQRNKLFQPFMQTQRHAGGTGLGLYSLALRIKTLGGTYGLKSTNDGVGSIFYFSIPFNEDTTISICSMTVVSNAEPNFCILDMEAVEEGENERETAEAEAEARQSKNISSSRSAAYAPDGDGSATVLLVDDSATTLKVLARAIRHSGVTVDTAVDGFSALKMMKSKFYTVVIMDIQMPIMDGLESVSQLRAWEKAGGRQETQYVIGASACTLEDTAADALRVGMNEFTPKPVDVPIILGKVKNLHDRAHLEICGIV
jgi:signal transduction histidine kinase/CheY-like chemotaxis protein